MHHEYGRLTLATAGLLFYSFHVLCVFNRRCYFYLSVIITSVIIRDVGQTGSGCGGAVNAVVGVGTPLLDGESGATSRRLSTGNENNSTGATPAPATPASPTESINRTGSKTCCFCWCCCCSCSWSVICSILNIVLVFLPINFVF